MSKAAAVVEVDAAVEPATAEVLDGTKRTFHHPPADSVHPTKDRADVTGVVKKTFNLPVESVNAIKELAAARSSSVTEVLKRAIWIEKYLHDETMKGGRVFVEFDDQP